MRETIAKREKGIYIFLVAISIFTAINSIGLLRFPIIQYLGIMAIVVSSMSAVIFSPWLFDRRPYIEAVGDTLVMVPGLKKITVKTSDITAVRVETAKGKSFFGKEKRTLIIEATVNGKTELFDLPEAKDVDAAYERLLQLIK